MQELKPQLKKETWKERLQFVWMGFRVLVYIVEIGVPFLVDALCGHMWGAVAAIGNIIVWIYCGLKSHMAPGTMMLWLFALLYVVMVAVVECAHLFHWWL